MLARLCSESYKLGFNSTWTEKFQIVKLDLENVEELEIKLPTFIGSWRRQGNSRKTSASLTTLKPLTVWTATNWKILKEMAVPDHLTCCQEATEPDMEQLTGSELGKEYDKAIHCYPAYLTSVKSTSWRMLCWMNPWLESRLLREISATSDLQMILL